MSEGYSNLRAQWESRMKESGAQSALASASPGAGDRKKPSSTATGSSSIPPWKKSAQAAAAKVKAKETDGAGSLTAPSSTNAGDTATTPSWTRPSLATHHAAETVEKYVASPSSTNDEASPTAATATAGGGQAEIVEEHSLSVSAAKSMFGGSVNKSRGSYGGSTGISGSGANSNDRAARWKAEAADASAAVGDDDDYNVEEDRITSITVTDAKSMFNRPSASAATATSDAPSSRPKWLTGGGINGSPPSASTGSDVPEAYAELFGVAHEYDKEKGTALGASGIIAEDGEQEEESGDSASGGDDGRPAWLKGQSESGEEIMDEEDRGVPQTYEDNTDVDDDVPGMASEPVVADWLQAEDQDEVVKSEKVDEADEPPPKKRGWGTNLMKWLERKESESGSDNNGSDKGSSQLQEQPGLIQEDNPIHEDDNTVGSGPHDNDAIEPSEGEEEGEEGPRRKQTEEEEAILAMMEAENQRYAQGQEVVATHRMTHCEDEGGAEIREMDALEHENVSDENNIQEAPNDNIATVAAGAVVAGAEIAAAIAPATPSAPLLDESAPIDFASSPTPSVEANVEADAEVNASYEETFDDYAGGYDDDYGGGHDDAEHYSEEDETDYVQHAGKATSSAPSARELSDEDYDEDMGNGGSYSDRSTEGLEANLSSAYGLGAADNDDYYQDQDEYDKDNYMENLDDDTVQDLEASYDREEGDANKSYTTVDKLEDEFLTETGERSSQERKIVEENEDTTDEEGVSRGRPVLYPEDSELSLDNTTVADERARLRQELEMEILQESDDEDDEGPPETQAATEDHASTKGFEAEASSSDDESEDNTALKAAALGLAAAAVAGGTAGAVAATRSPDDVSPPPKFFNDQDDAEMGYDDSPADAPLEYEEQAYPVAAVSAGATDEVSDARFEEEPNEVEPNEENSNEDEALYAKEGLGNYEYGEAGADADNSYADEDAPYSDQSTHQDAGGDWGEEERNADEEHYADEDDYPLYHPSTDVNENAAGDKLYDYEDVDSGYSNKVEATGDFSDDGSGRNDAVEDQEEEGHRETSYYPDGYQPRNVQEESTFEESMSSEALNARANLMREELTDEIDREKQEQGNADEGHASTESYDYESYDYYNEPESKRELKARIDSIHSEVVVDEDKDEGSGREAGAVVGAAAVSSDTYHDEDNSVKELPEDEDDNSTVHGHEAVAVAGAAALAAAATAGSIAVASTEEEVQAPVISAPKEDQYAARASHVSQGEDTLLTWGESDLNAAPEPPAQYSETGANSENYLEEKEKESGYDEYGDADYNDGNVIAMDMAAPIDFSNPPPEPSSDDPYNDDGYGQSNDDDGYYQDETEQDGYYQDYAETEQDGYYQEDDLQDDYYQSNEFSQDHQEGGYVAEEDEWGESGQAKGTYDKEEDQNNEAAYAAGGLVATAVLGGGIAAAAATGDDTLPSNPVGPDKEPGDYGPKARSPSIRLKKSVVEEQRQRERLPMDAIVESESFPEVERDIEFGYDEGFLPDEHVQNGAMSVKASTSASASKRVSWDKDIDQDHPSNMKKWCILAVIIVALGGIALGVTFSLSKRNNSSSDTQNAQDSPPGSKDTPSTRPHTHDGSHEHPEILFTQVGGGIAGPSRTFEYGPGTNGQFGSSLSLSGDGTRLAIGAPNYSASIFSQGERLGLVQVFEQQNGAWTKLEPDIFGDLSGDATGTSVSLSSDGMTLAVGSPEHLDAIFGGQVILYQFTDDGVWQQTGNPIIGDDAFDRLGMSVSLSDKGDRVAISQPTDKAGGAARKVAKVYEFQNNDWVQLGDDLVGRFGSDPVSMSGDGQVVALGSLSRAEKDHRAAIRTYHYVNETSTNETVGWKLKGSEIELEGAKGSSYDTLWMPTLSTDGKILAIGSAIENFNKTEKPNEQQVLQVLTYQFDEELDDWREIPVNTDLDMQGLDLSRFSTSLSGDGHELVVGDSGVGIIEILHLSDEGAYMPVKGNIELKGADGSDDAFGYSVAVSSDGIYLASGAPQQVVAGKPVGSVSVFQMEITEHH